jgi:hypothetical protein
LGQEQAGEDERLARV